MWARNYVIKHDRQQPQLEQSQASALSCQTPNQICQNTNNRVWGELVMHPEKRGLVHSAVPKIQPFAREYVCELTNTNITYTH